MKALWLPLWLFSPLLVFFIGCGDQPLLQSGIYEVDVHYTRDDWPMSMTGQTTRARWQIDDANGVYELRVLGASTAVTGYADGSELIFDQVNEYGNCDDLSTFRARLLPNAKANRFTGDGSIVVLLCGGERLITQTALEGAVER